MTRQELAQELFAHSISAELAWALLDNDEELDEADLESVFSWGGGGDPWGESE